LYKCIRRDRGSPFREGLNLLPHPTLGGFARKEIDGEFAAGWTAPFDELVG
jgi:hypothetical protein